MSSKACSRCKLVKPLSDFSRHHKYGRQYNCKKCCSEVQSTYQRSYTDRQKMVRRLSRYKLTIKQYKKMKKRQGGRCAVCRCKLVEGNRRTHVDHNHAMGMLREDPVIVQQLLDYILFWQAEEEADAG